MAVAVLNAKTRLKAKKDVTVPEVQEILCDIMREKGTRDLLGIFRKLADTWTSAPSYKNLVASGSTIQKFLVLFPNTILPHALLCKATEAEHGREACIFPSGQIGNAIGELSLKWRIAASKWRE